MTDSPSPQSPGYELIRQPDGRLVMRPTHDPDTDDASTDPCPGANRTRRISAFILDWIIHVLCGAAVGIAISPSFSKTALADHDWAHLGVNPAAVIGSWLLVSFLDRVILQSMTHTTIGKALFGLRIAQPEDCLPPSFLRLFASWLMSFYTVVVLTLATIFDANDAPGLKNSDRYFLSAIRRGQWR